MTLEEALESKKTDPVKPKILDYYSEITGIGEDEFVSVLEAQREMLQEIYHPQKR